MCDQDSRGIASRKYAYAKIANPHRILIDFVPVLVVLPSLIWITLDHSVWMWDQAVYGKASVELFYTLFYEAKNWPSRMLSVLSAQAPGVSWFGQLFVPLGRLLGSIEAGLLASIVVNQMLTLVLMFRIIRQFTAHDELVSLIGVIIIGSAPLFVALSHQYVTEPLQLLAVTWFCVTMSFAPKWSSPFILGQLAMAIPVALLAKVSSPLYCIGPGLLAAIYIFKPKAYSSAGSRSEPGNPYRAIIFGTSVLLFTSAAAWYLQNIRAVLQHVSISSSGPIAEIYGKKDDFLSTLTYWLGALGDSFFAPKIFILVAALWASAIIVFLKKGSVASKHFTVCFWVSSIQIALVLTVFSFSSNRELRYLLPLLPYIAIMISWSLAQLRFRLLKVLIAVLFVGQLIITYGQALGLSPHFSTTPWWLLPPNTTTGPKENLALGAMIESTCSPTEPRPYLNIIGIEKPWLNEHSANFVVAKNRLNRKPMGCYYGSFGYETDTEQIWKNLLLIARYFITLDPASTPIPPQDAHLKAINANYLPILKKVQSSALFELQKPLKEDGALLIFRRNRKETPR
jgi:hypothetical protein